MQPGNGSIHACTWSLGASSTESTDLFSHFHIFSTGTRQSRVAGLPVIVTAGMKKNVYEAKFL